MKCALKLLFILAFLSVGVSFESNRKPKPEDVSTVYICTGPNAKAYHSTDQCHSLSNCSDEIKQVGIDVVSLSREPCDQCFDKTDIKLTHYNEVEDTRIKKYVYLDRQNVLHYTLACDVLRPIEENHTEEYAISFIEIDNLDLPPHWYCSRCYTNRSYEKIAKREHNLQDTLIYSE